MNKIFALLIFLVACGAIVSKKKEDNGKTVAKNGRFMPSHYFRSFEYEPPVPPTASDEYRKTLIFPNLSELDSAVDYVILRPSQFTVDTCGDPGTFDDCDQNTPGCVSDTRFLCANKTWDTYIVNALKASNTLKYILFAPGDYRPLGRFSVNDTIYTAKRVYMLFYDETQDNPWYPKYRDTLDAQFSAILEGFYYTNTDSVTHHGFMFRGYGLDYSGNKFGWGCTVDGNGGKMSDGMEFYNCILRQAKSTGIRIRNSYNSRMQDCIFHTQGDPCGSDAPAYYIQSTAVDTRVHYLVDCQIYNYVDGVQVGNERPEGTRADSIFIIGNDFFVTPDTYTTIVDSGEYSTYENAIDIKLSGPDWVYIKYNKIHGFRPTRSGFGCAVGSLGKGLTIHFNADSLQIIGNLIYDCNVGVSNTGSMEDNIVDSNIFENITVKALTGQPFQSGTAVLNQTNMVRFKSKWNRFYNTTRNYGYIGGWSALDTLAHDIKDNFRLGHIITFESGSVNQTTLDNYNNRNILFKDNIITKSGQ